MKKRIAAARVAALAVLEKVAGGGYASDLLRDATQGLSARDAGLAGQIVLGSLRVQNQLDFLIERYSGRPANSLDLVVLLALRTAIFQLRYMDRIPPHAAVDDAVEFVKKHKRAASGLTNAVLRKTNRDPVEWPNEAVEFGCPDWMLARWKKQYGTAAARAIALAALQEPAAYTRIRTGDRMPTEVQLEATSVAGCYLVVSPAAGELRLHDIGSQTIVPLLELSTEHSYLDLCSAPGNKTSQALEANPKLAVACDISERRLKTVTQPTERVVLDASEQLPFDCKFDRILVDAPCSGTGTLCRNPEIKWRMNANDLVRQQARQVNIVKRSAEVLAAGGKLLYVTCSLEVEENEDVVRQAEAQKGLICERQVVRLPGRDAGDGFFAALLSRRQ